VTALEAHNRRRGVEGRPPLKMGVGVHFGAVVAGNIGTVEHAQYTIIGDTVNLAARLEAATKDLGVPVLVSRALKDAAGETGVALVSLGSLVVRGRDEAVEIFGLPTA
jgi:adenylate cyclase